jgi:heme/copper-type cytochrome/quinol oxidase subunit 3
MQQELLEEHLTREELQALKNKRAGMFIFQVSWIMAFVCMVVVNWQLRFSADWLPPGSVKAGVILPTFATAALLLSAMFARRGLKTLQVDQIDGFLTQWIGAIGLGFVFVVVIAYEWLTIDSGTQYGQVFRLMTGFHMVHALIIGGYMFNVYIHGRKGMYGQFDFWAVEAGAKLWYFVLVAWALFYIVIYWA